MAIKPIMAAAKNESNEKWRGVSEKAKYRKWRMAYNQPHRKLAYG